MEGLSADTVPALSSWRNFTQDGNPQMFSPADPAHWAVCCIRALDILCGNAVHSGNVFLKELIFTSDHY